LRARCGPCLGSWNTRSDDGPLPAAVGAGAVVLGGFLLANLVAAGIHAVLMPMVHELARTETDLLVAGIVIGCLAVACAVFFLIGFVSEAR
jgi:hypothetical protein